MRNLPASFVSWGLGLIRLVDQFMADGLGRGREGRNHGRGEGGGKTKAGTHMAHSPLPPVQISSPFTTALVSPHAPTKTPHHRGGTRVPNGLYRLCSDTHCLRLPRTSINTPPAMAVPIRRAHFVRGNPLLQLNNLHSTGCPSLVLLDSARSRDSSFPARGASSQRMPPRHSASVQ